MIKQDSTLFYCDSVVLNKSRNLLEAFGHVHINDNDSVHTYSDYLRYFGNEKKAYLNGHVKLTDGSGTLTTPDLDYNLNTHIGIYTKGGKVVSDKTVLTSKEAYYYGETRDVYFKKDVVLVNPDYNVTTDTLLFNTYTNVATFTVPTLIKSGDKRKIFTSDGYYDLKNKKAYFAKRPHIEDSTTILDANVVASDDSTRFSEASGNVVYKDTAQGVTILSNNLKNNGNESSFLATQKPIMIIKQDTDSLYMAADTFFSARLSSLRRFRKVPVIVDSLKAVDSGLVKDSSTAKLDSATDRFVEAYFNVKIFSDSLQAVGDSLFYSSEDSAFRLFKDPAVWSRESQITGDTIYLFTHAKQAKRLYVFENALSIQKVGADYYNQVKGRTLNAFFIDGELEHVRAKGNSESIYYGQDDSSKFIGSTPRPPAAGKPVRRVEPARGGGPVVEQGRPPHRAVRAPARLRLRPTVRRPTSTTNRSARTTTARAQAGHGHAAPRPRTTRGEHPETAAVAVLADRRAPSCPPPGADPRPPPPPRTPASGPSRRPDAEPHHRPTPPTPASGPSHPPGADPPR